MTDCFAYRHQGKCVALTSDRCEGKCEFYKPTEQRMAGRAAAFKRLARLPREQQREIADTYYRGEMPWHSDLEVQA